MPIPDSHVDLARISLRVGDKLSHRLCWYRWIDHHDIRRTADSADRRSIADELVIELFIEGCIDSVWGTDEQECMAVRSCTDNGLGSDIPASTRSILDDEWLAKPF